MTQSLPIDDVLEDVTGALRATGRVVLQAPPGAGKTTRVPLAMLEAGLTLGKIVMLEPRRLAARAAAARMAETLGEAVGQTVGYRVRGDSKVSANTRIEVVTEGILTRMIQSDPELSGIGAVIFDEIHERSLQGDLGLALCLEVADALREDLMIVAMSATLDAGPVAALLGDAPLVTSEGRSFPVDIRWADSPLPAKARLEDAVSDTILKALAETDGGMLVFLPGEPEIRRVSARIAPKLSADVALRPLFGAMPFAEQQAAVRPERATGGGPAPRKLVLATAIAETSLTIPDIRVVVDAGRARRARFDPGSGMTRLVTEPAARAESTQRAGRAGRVAPGVAYRLWTKGEDGARPAFAPAEIESADLTGLALDVALWGAAVEDMPFLTPPPSGPWQEARSLLTMLGALEADGRLSAHGKALARLPLHPRLAHMLVMAGPEAAPLAALLADRDPLRGAPVDLSLRLEAIADLRQFRERRPYQVHAPAIERLRAEAGRLRRDAKSQAKSGLSPAQMAALAYPDRVGLRRKGDAPRYLLSGGKGAHLMPDDPLAATRLIVVTDTDGNPRDARIRQAIAISEGELRANFGGQIAWQSSCTWSRREARVVARKQERLGAIALDDRQWKDAPDTALLEGMLDGVRELGLIHSDATRRFIARVDVARAGGHELPAMDDESLMASIDSWLAPHLTGLRTESQWRGFDMLPALRARLSWEEMQTLDRVAPAHFTTPLGRQIPIDYGPENPEISLRLQEMFGQTTHPSVAGRPLRVTLLSPARRPVQTTMDIPGFWDTSYADVRRDMRGRYPKHPWPENPREADPTLRAKPRK